MTLFLYTFFFFPETLDKQEGVPKVYNRMEVQVNRLRWKQNPYPARRIFAKTWISGFPPNIRKDYAPLFGMQI